MQNHSYIENARNSATLGSHSARQINLQEPLPNVYEARRYKSKLKSHRSQSRNYDVPVMILQQREVKKKKSGRSTLSQRDPSLYLQQQLYSEETGKHMVRADKVKRTIQDIKKLSPTLIINLNAQTASKNLPIELQGKERSIRVKKKVNKHVGGIDGGPSIEEQKQQKWRKQNFLEPEKNQYREEGQEFPSVLLDNVSLDGKRVEHQGRKYITPVKSKTQKFPDKHGTHTEQRVLTVKHFALNYPRNEELQWMLKHSPYIAESGTQEKKHFIHAVTSSHNSQRQLKNPQMILLQGPPKLNHAASDYLLPATASSQKQESRIGQASSVPNLHTERSAARTEQGVLPVLPGSELNKQKSSLPNGIS